MFACIALVASLAQNQCCHCNHTTLNQRYSSVYGKNNRRHQSSAGLSRLLSSKSNNLDLWKANGQLSTEWPSSLPLPENASHNPSLAQRAEYAMSGPYPPALEGHCNVNFDFNDQIQWQHVDPPVLTIDNFLSDKECDDILKLQNVSPPPGAGRVIKMESRISHSNLERSGGTAIRSSTTWYVRYGAPQIKPLLKNLLHLLPNVKLEQCEEVQLVRYQGGGQGFGWHEDVLSVDEANLEAGGQRIATILLYLNDCENGRTLFRDLRGWNGRRLAVSPRKGRALLFFPSVTGNPLLCDAAAKADLPMSTFGDVYFDGTRADHRTAHAGEPPGNNGQKNIAQIWVHSREHVPRAFGIGLNKHSELIL